MAGKKKKDQHDANQVGVGLTPAYGGTYGTTPPLSQIPYLGGVKSMVPEAPSYMELVFVARRRELTQGH
ncbi:hypothetical protein OIU78_011372 [Salix suchowensis]|nr:hypothetical protein OIU78_011372 [Salix suchowensis]